MLNAALDRAAQASPAAIAIINTNGQTVTFDRFAATIWHFSARLSAAGLAPGQTLFAMVDNPAVALALNIAGLRLGAVPIFLPVATVTRTGLMPDLVVHLPDQRAFGRKTLTFDATWAVPETVQPGPVPFAPEPGIVLGSSGSTGLSKLMTYPPTGLYARNNAMNLVMDVPQGMVASFLDAGSAMGLRVIYRSFLAGRGVLLAGTMDQTLDLMLAHDIRDVVAGGPAITSLCEGAETRGLQVQLDSLQAVGSLVSLAVQRRVQQVFGCITTVLYGLSEVGSLAAGQPLLTEPEEGLCGACVPSVEWRFLDEDGLDTTGTGRIAIRVPPDCRSSDYLNAEGPFDAEGWMVTSDLGYRRTDGQLVIIGRADDVINPGGTGWHPAVIEGFSLGFPGLRQITAFGLRRPEGFDALWLALVTDTSFDETAFRAHVGARLGNGGFAVNLLYLPDLPRNANGKVDRPELRKRASQMP